MHTVRLGYRIFPLSFLLCCSLHGSRASNAFVSGLSIFLDADHGSDTKRNRVGDTRHALELPMFTGHQAGYTRFRLGQYHQEKNTCIMRGLYQLNHALRYCDSADGNGNINAMDFLCIGADSFKCLQRRRSGSSKQVLVLLFALPLRQGLYALLDRCRAVRCAEYARWKQERCPMPTSRRM